MLSMKNNHLTIIERKTIEILLNEGYSFTEIANTINRSLSTVSREIRNHTQTVFPSSFNGSNICIKSKKCPNTKLECYKYCLVAEFQKCEKLNSATQVCNSCTSKQNCRHPRHYYTADQAEKEYLDLLHNSRTKLHYTEEEWIILNTDLVTLIRNNKSIFHSVSAFCNAGFDTIGKYNSLSDYVADPLVSLVICALIIIGGLGFIVWRDLFLYFKKRQNLSFYSKIVLLMTVSMLAGGTVLIFIFECENPNFSSYSIPTLLLASFFQSTVTRTAGFFSINLAEMSSPSVAVSMLLMFIGGASGSTAGGIKVATLAVVIIAVISIMKGKNNFEIFHRRISLNNTLRAMGILALAFTVVTAFTFLICLIQPEFTFTQVLYEVISAFATVGQTLGITTELNAVSKLLISLLMYFGRVGIITFTYAVLFKQSKSENLISYPEANVLLG